MIIRALHYNRHTKPQRHYMFVWGDDIVNSYYKRSVRRLYRQGRKNGLSPANARYFLVDVILVGNSVESCEYVKPEEARHG
jgi:hypothetical protein